MLITKSTICLKMQRLHLHYLIYKGAVKVYYAKLLQNGKLSLVLKNTSALANNLYF